MASHKHLDRILKIAFYSNQHSARFMLALAETFWCLALLWPGDTFIRPTYEVMASVANETAWAVIFGLTAFCQWVIFLHGQYNCRFACRFATWNMLLWWFVTVSMYLSVYPPPAAISGELALAIGASWIYVRSGLGVNGRRESDD